MYYDEEYATIVKFQKLPTFLPMDHIGEKVLPGIAIVVAILTCVYNIFFLLLVPLWDPTLTASQKRKASYQLTNLFVNFVFGSMGLYYFLNHLPKNPTVDESVLSTPFLYLYPLPCLQIGYQLWALPMGILVKETPAMLTHHICVIFVSSMAGFLTIGFRFWSPFFFGMIELSSVPLAVMNSFKDHPKRIERYPNLYQLVRITFSLAFLFLRWFMYYPRKYIFLRQALWAIMSSESWTFKVFFTFVWVSSFIIASLQAIWGSLIIKGIIKALSRCKKKNNKIYMNGEAKMNGYQVKITMNRGKLD